jgi:hypothetical protein
LTLFLLLAVLHLVMRMLVEVVLEVCFTQVQLV